jgi:hypothetical protein
MDGADLGRERGGIGGRGIPIAAGDEAERYEKLSSFKDHAVSPYVCRAA